MYEQPTADFGDFPLLIIKIKKSLDEGKSTYDATRVAWKLNPDRAALADWVIAASQGQILEVFEVDAWLPAFDPEFKGLIDTENDQGRYGFVGRPAPEAVRQRWIHHRLPDEYMRQGAASPIRYANFG